MNVWRLVAFALVCLVARGAAAGTVAANGSMSAAYGAGSVTFGESGVGSPFQDLMKGRTYDPGDVPSHIKVTEEYGTHFGGNDITIKRARRVPIKSVARAAAKIIPVISTGMAVYDLWEDLRIKCKEDGTCGRDPGVDQEVAQQWCIHEGADGVICSPSAAGTASQHLAKYTNVNAGYCLLTDFVNGNQYINIHYTLAGELYRDATHVNFGTIGSCRPARQDFEGPPISVSLESQLRCPGSTDFGDPSLSIPAGLPPQSDGKCKTGRYDHPPLNMPDAGDYGESHAPPGTDWPKIAKESQDKGQDLPNAGPGTMSGPSSKQGQPSTTTTQSTKTSPGGTTGTTSTSVTTTPTTNYTYNTDQITYNITNVTVTNTTYADGSTETTTEGETKPVDPSDDACAKAPDTVGCSKLGDPGSDKPAWLDKTIDFQVEDLGLGGGSCPGPRSIDLPWSGLHFAIDYKPACDIAPSVALVLKALVALSCAGFIISTVKT